MLIKKCRASAFAVSRSSPRHQPVDHAHLHVIPRYAGDVPEPRGGIRWIISAKAPYWQL